MLAVEGRGELKNEKFEEVFEKEREILLVGDERLRKISTEVDIVNDKEFEKERNELEAILQKFRVAKGFGRAIAAPQIGINKRFIACDLGNNNKFCVINPKITSKSEEKFTMWDDCLSFPWLLVKVERHKFISIEYYNEKGEKIEWNNMTTAESELFQHEIDHLDGILGLDHVVDGQFLSREIYDRNPSYYNSQVDYFIQPTI